MAENFELIGSVSTESIRDLLTTTTRFEEAVVEVKRRTPSQKTPKAEAPVAWLHRTYDEGHPTCVKIGRFGDRKKPGPAIQLYFDRSRRLLKGTDLTENVADAIHQLMVESKSYGRRRPTKIQIANVTRDALKPFLDKGKWRIEPYFFTPKSIRDKNRLVAVVEDGWIKLLLDWVNNVYRRQASDENFVALVRRYREFGPKQFFKSPKELKFWNIVAHWDNWRRAGFGLVDVQKALGEMGHEYTYRGLWNVCYETHKLDRLSDEASEDDPERASVSVNVIEDT